jgi:hypothetical protein
MKIFVMALFIKPILRRGASLRDDPFGSVAGQERRRPLNYGQQSSGVASTYRLHPGLLIRGIQAREASGGKECLFSAILNTRSHILK